MTRRDEIRAILFVSLMERVEGLTADQAAECAEVALEVLNP